MVTYEELWTRVEKMAYVKPKTRYVREYFVLIAEAEKLFQKLRAVKNLELTEEIELPYIEKLVEELEEKMKKIEE